MRSHSSECRRRFFELSPPLLRSEPQAGPCGREKAENNRQVVDDHRIDQSPAWTFASGNQPPASDGAERCEQESHDYQQQTEEHVVTFKESNGSAHYQRDEQRHADQQHQPEHDLHEASGEPSHGDQYLHDTRWLTFQNADADFDASDV